MTVKHWQDNWTNTHWHWKKLTLNQRILVSLVFIALATTLISALFNQDSSDAWFSGFAQNFSTEMMGAIITFGLIEQIVRREDENSIEARQKRRLQILAGSRSNAVAVGALDELRAEGWLDILQDDETMLRGANWQNAYLPGITLPEKEMRQINLKGAHLDSAKLERAHLRNANLESAYLKDANLEGAHLQNANLEGAYLRDANLEGAYLERANLEGATLWLANLASADLWNANLADAKLSNANLAGTRLFQANLAGASLWEANLTGASLFQANLAGASLLDANLAGASLLDANLAGASLLDANLAGAKLSNANLAGASLLDATLEHANLSGVTCNENTTLPDGSTWTEQTDWTKYGAVKIKDGDKWYAYLYQHDLLRQYLSRWDDTGYENHIQYLRDMGLID